MSRHSSAEVQVAIETAGVVPLFYHPDPVVTVEVAQACAAGGAMAVEFTNRGDRALAVFHAAADQLGASDPALMLGIGSVVDAGTAALYIDAGADFIVGPYFVPAIARLCHRGRLTYIPGAATPGEIATAEASGVGLVKLFPASVLGPAFVRHHLGPSPHSRLIPTGGIDASAKAVTAWIRAGAVAVGIGSHLIRASAITPADLDRLPDRLRDVSDWVAAARLPG